MTHTPGQWSVQHDSDDHLQIIAEGVHYPIADLGTVNADDYPAQIIAQLHADARLIAAAPDLLEAAQLLEAAELEHANCEECEGQDVPELCPVCFPLFDDARVKRRLAIAKAVVGRPKAEDL